MTSSIENKLHEATGKLLLSIIKDGRKFEMENGEVVTKQASAADIKAAIDWLKHNGVSQQAAADNPVGNMIEEMRKRNMSFGEIPPLDEDGDDAASA